MYCRKLTEHDIENVCELYLTEEELEYTHREWQGYVTRAKEVYGQMILNGSYTMGCFSKDNKDLLGVLNVNKINDYYPKYENQPYIHLETFIVSKNHQGRGVGTFLMKCVLEQLDVEGYTYIIIQSKNKYVQRIATKLGLVDSSQDMRIDRVKLGSIERRWS